MDFQSPGQAALEAALRQSQTFPNRAETTRPWWARRAPPNTFEAGGRFSGELRASTLSAADGRAT
jgi:hypothetical protein